MLPSFRNTNIGRLPAGHKLPAVTTIVALALGAVACQHAAVASPPSPARYEAGIRAARIAQNAAILARNADSVASFWVDDVTVTAGLGYVVRGRADYKAAFGRDAAMTYQRTTERVVVSTTWPLAWEEGTWLGTAIGQVLPAIGGRYAAQWVRQNGRWYIRSELFVAIDCTGDACKWPIRLTR
jgi:ketosteroid isomerase-like protein